MEKSRSRVSHHFCFLFPTQMDKVVSENELNFSRGLAVLCVHAFFIAAFYSPAQPERAFYPRQASGLAVVTGVLPSSPQLPSFSSRVGRSHSSAFCVLRFLSNFACYIVQGFVYLRDVPFYRIYSEYMITVYIIHSPSYQCYHITYS